MGKLRNTLKVTQPITGFEQTARWLRSAARDVLASAFDEEIVRRNVNRNHLACLRLAVEIKVPPPAPTP